MGPHRNFFLALVPLVRLRGYFLLGPNCRPHVRWVDHPSRHLGWKCGSCCLICFCDYCGCGRCWVRDCRWEWCGVRHWQRGVNNLGPGILGSWHMKNTCCQGNLGALPLEICTCLIFLCMILRPTFTLTFVTRPSTQPGETRAPSEIDDLLLCND